MTSDEPDREAEADEAKRVFDEMLEGITSALGVPSHVLDRARRVAGKTAGEMLEFLKGMGGGDVQIGERSGLCSQAVCIHAAKWTYVWPGRRDRLMACDICIAKARSVAAVMGFKLGDVHELSKEFPIEVRLDLGDVIRAKADIAAEAVPEFEGAKDVGISISNAEVIALVMMDTGPRVYPISKLWLRFQFMGEACILSCEDGQGANTKWFSEDSGRDYMELIEPNSMRMFLSSDAPAKFTVEADA